MEKEKRQEIILLVDNEKDLYTPFSPEYEFSDQVIAYITSKMEGMHSQNLVLKVVSEVPVNEEHFRAAVRSWIEAGEAQLERERKRNIIKQAWMFGAGAAFIAISLLLEKSIPVLPYTILSTIGAFSIWEASSVWIIQRPKNRLKKRMISRLKRDGSVEFEAGSTAQTGRN